MRDILSVISSRAPPAKPRGGRWSSVAASLLGLLAVGSFALIDSRGEAWGGGSADVRFIRAFTNDDGSVDDPARDPGDDGIDPGYEKSVANCGAVIAAHDRVRVTVVNGYPSYTCTLWVKVYNSGTKDVRQKGVRISAPPQLGVRPGVAPACKLLRRGKWAWWSFQVHVEQAASYQTSYTFTVKLDYEDLGAKGTCG